MDMKKLIVTSIKDVKLLEKCLENDAIVSEMVETKTSTLYYFKNSSSPIGTPLSVIKNALVNFMLAFNYFKLKVNVKIIYDLINSTKYDLGKIINKVVLIVKNGRYYFVKF